MLVFIFGKERAGHPTSLHDGRRRPRLGTEAITSSWTTSARLRTELVSKAFFLQESNGYGPLGVYGGTASGGRDVGEEVTGTGVDIAHRIIMQKLSLPTVNKNRFHKDELDVMSWWKLWNS